ncbi:J domain-containing protein [Micromonospora sp. NPDC003816]|uniref:J domain-containing protein n=1 Tax=Micromonospora sp. NPDC003816 TaxID=3364224 RepID=UPI00367E5433
MSPDGQDPYLLLGVDRDSTPAQIRERYHILVQLLHPDRHQSSPEKVRAEATRQMQQINVAYKFLIDAHSRETRERERRARDREEREREARRREAEEREARERKAREREARRREAEKREAREREAQKSEARERKARDREQQRREREIRERQHPRARWTYPSYNPVDLTEPLAIRPITISLPKDGEGYTLGAYLDEQQEQTALLGAEGHLLLFRTRESLHRYLTEPAAHELAEAPGWDSFMNWVLRTGMRDGDERSYDFTLIIHFLRETVPQWDPQLFITHRDFVADVTQAFGCDDLRNLLRLGSPIDELDDLLRVSHRPLAGWKARRELYSGHSRTFDRAWRDAISLIRKRVRWLR